MRGEAGGKLKRRYLRRLAKSPPHMTSKGNMIAEWGGVGHNIHDKDLQQLLFLLVRDVTRRT